MVCSQEASEALVRINSAKSRSDGASSRGIQASVRAELGTPTAQVRRRLATPLLIVYQGAAPAQAYSIAVKVSKLHHQSGEDQCRIRVYLQPQRSKLPRHDALQIEHYPAWLQHLLVSIAGEFNELPVSHHDSHSKVATIYWDV